MLRSISANIIQLYCWQCSSSVFHIWNWKRPDCIYLKNNILNFKKKQFWYDLIVFLLFHFIFPALMSFTLCETKNAQCPTSPPKGVFIDDY